MADPGAVGLHPEMCDGGVNRDHQALHHPNRIRPQAPDLPLVRGGGNGAPGIADGAVEVRGGDEVKKPMDTADVELAYRSTQESVNSLAKRFGMSEPTLRRLVKKNGWIRCAPESKRRVVADAMAGVTKGLTNDEVRQAQENAATEDIADMAQGIRVFRNVLGAMETASETVQDPRDAKVITEATEKAINGIRTIRGLDDPTEDQTITVEFPDSE